MLYYNLKNRLTIEKITNDLNKIISKMSQDELIQSVLKISIQKISTYEGDPLVPKIEYKEQGSLT